MAKRKAPVNKPKFTENEMAGALGKAGTITGASLMLGCTRGTVYEYIKKFPELENAIKDAREMFCDVAETALFKNLKKGQAASVHFYLRTQGKGRGYTERTELTGRDGHAIDITNQAANNFDNAMASKLKAATATKVSKKPKPRRKSKAKS